MDSRSLSPLPLHQKNDARELFVANLKVVKNQKLEGFIFVLTGTLKTMSRDEAKEKIRALGGEISESVSKKTSYVVVGEEPGSKYGKAKQLGIKIINERKFLEMIEI